ncbi:MAG: type II toxin-antitoxin system YafQ family toxin [Chlorobium sp.]|nr:type II toxin-antitoxin system YafQ family toxin [Chlorobium sp.]
MASGEKVSVFYHPMPSIMRLWENSQGTFDCHIKPGLVLIYRKTDDDVLDLVRLGSHSEPGL